MEKKTKALEPKDVVRVGSPEEKAYLYNLKNDITKADGDFIGFMAKAVNLKERKASQTDSQTDVMNMYYNRMMLMQCIEPVSKGVNKESIIQAVGMTVGLSLFNPEFQKYVNNSAATALYPTVDRLASRFGENSIWAKQRDFVITKANDGRLPFTAKSAAIQSIAFGRDLYDELRKEGANRSELINNYMGACNELGEQAVADGCSMDDIHRSQRTIIGQMIEKDPSFAQYFNETAYGDVKRADYQIDPDDSRRQVWRGEFVQSDDTSFTGAFTPRVVMDVDFHAAKLNEFLHNSFADCRTAGQIRDVMNNEDHIRERSLKMDMMYADGMTLDEVQDILTDMTKANMKDWMDKNPDAVKVELERMRSEKQAKSAESSSNTKNRGHEFDDLFDADYYDNEYQ